MPAGLGAGLVEIVAWRAGELELSGRLQAHAAILARERNDIAAFLDRLPAKFGQARKQIADAAGLVIAGRAMVGSAIDELLVLGADLPARGGLLAFFEQADELIAALDDRICACRFPSRVLMPCRSSHLRGGP